MSCSCIVCAFCLYICTLRSAFCYDAKNNATESPAFKSMARLQNFGSWEDGERCLGQLPTWLHTNTHVQHTHN